MHHDDNTRDDFHTSTPWVTQFTEQGAVDFHNFLMEQVALDPFRPVILHVSSYGGEADALASMLDSMDVARALAGPDFKILTVAMGKTLSAGAVLLAYGDYRFATSRTRIMLHQMVSGLQGSHPDNEVAFDDICRQNNEMLQLLIDRCKLPYSIKEFKEKLRQDFYMTPGQALEFGLIDAIGYPKLFEQPSYEIRVLNGVGAEDDVEVEEPAPEEEVKKSAKRRKPNKSATKSKR